MRRILSISCPINCAERLTLFRVGRPLAVPKAGCSILSWRRAATFIEEEFSLRPPTATQLLKKMEQGGLIRREVMADDGRMKRIIVNEKALQYKDVVIADITRLEEELIRGIPQEEMDVFFKVVGKMMENVS